MNDVYYSQAIKTLNIMKIDCLTEDSNFNNNKI